MKLELEIECCFDCNAHKQAHGGVDYKVMCDEICREVRRLVPNSTFYLNRVPPHLKKQPDYPPRTCFHAAEQKMVTFPRIGAFEYRFGGEITPFFSSLQMKMHPDKTYILALIFAYVGERRTKLPQINARIQSKTPDLRTQLAPTPTVAENSAMQRTFYFDKTTYDKIDMESFGRKTQNTFMRLRLPKVEGGPKQIEQPSPVRTSVNFKEEVKAFKLTIKDRLRALDKLSEKNKPQDELANLQEIESTIKDSLSDLYERVIQQATIIDPEIKLLPVYLSRLYDLVIHACEQLRIQKENEQLNEAQEFDVANYLPDLYQTVLKHHQAGEHKKRFSIPQISLRRFSVNTGRRFSQTPETEDSQEEDLVIDKQPKLVVSHGSKYRSSLVFQSKGLVEFAANYKTTHSNENE